MSIDPDKYYSLFEFSDEDQPLWEIRQPLSGDLVAGLIVGLIVLLNDMVTNFAGTYMYKVDVVHPELRGVSVYLWDDESKFLPLKNYIIDVYNLNGIYHIHNIADKLEFNDWVWRIKDSPQSYYLLKFRTPDFIQGFITICSAFGVDFRNYVLGHPFKYHDYLQPPVYYDIEGYDIDKVPQT